MRSFILYILIIFISITGFSQGKSFSEHIINNEKSLAKKFRILRASRKNDVLLKNNKIFIDGLKIMLKDKEAFTYPFDSLKTMSKITSPDKEFRLFNWNVEMEGENHKFFCFILKKDGTIIELKDKHKTISKPQTKILNNKNWYGAVYYQIIPMKGKQYTLLGWNGKGQLTTQKLIEVMKLSKRKAKFGASIFKLENKKDRRRRFILEYADDAFVSLKYSVSKKKKQIIYSHLSPSTPQVRGHYQFYYPDLSYDSFFLEKGKWIFENSADARNNKNSKDKYYNNPYDPNNPIEGGRR